MYKGAFETEQPHLFVMEVPLISLEIVRSILSCQRSFLPPVTKSEVTKRVGVWLHVNVETVTPRERRKL